MLVSFIVCILTAGVVYYLMEYRSYSESQEGLNRLLALQADAVATKKELQGYTSYLECLSVGKQYLLEKLKTQSVKVTREYVHVEPVHKSPTVQKVIGVVTVTYTVDFHFGFTVRPESVDVLATPSGVEIKVFKPSFNGAPRVRVVSQHVPIEGVMAEAELAPDQIHGQLTHHALKHGIGVAAEDAVHTLCAAKITALFKEFLALQPTVKHFPDIVVTFK